MSVYNYNTLTRTNDGTDFEFNTNCNVIFVDTLPTGVTINLKLDSPSNQSIVLREKTQLRFKQNNRLYFSPSASTTGTIRIFLYLDESNLLEFDQSQYSSESTITGTVDVDLVGQSGADPLNVDITAQSLSPLNNNIIEFGSSTTEVGYLQDVLTQFNGMRTDRTASWTYLVTTASLLYTAPAGYDVFLTSAQLSGFQLSAGDATLFLYHGNSSGGITYVLLTFTMNEIDPAISTIKGTNTVSINFGTLGYKIPSGDTVYLQSPAAAWGSGTIQAYRVPT